MSEVPDVTVSIVNWNTSATLPRCLRAIFEGTRTASYEVFVIDNNSSDNFLEVQKQFKDDSRITFIQNKENAYLLAKNQSYRLGRGKYFLALGPDAIVDSGCIDGLYFFLESHPKAGGVTANLMNPDRTPQRYYRRLLTPLRFFITTHMGQKVDKLLWKGSLRRWFVYEDIDLLQVSEVEQPPGEVCLMTRRSALPESNIIDPSLPFYFGDVDICKRIYDAGFKIYLIPDALVVHEKSASSLKVSSAWRDNARRQGLFSYFRKNYLFALPMVVLVTYLDASVVSVASYFRTRFLRH